MLNAPTVAEPLGLFDCCGVSDGAACAIVATPEVARSLGKKDMISIKALQVAVSNGLEAQHNSWDGSYFATTRIASKRAYAEAGIDKPREQLSLIEVHDCFSVTELVTMEDLHISPEGGAIKDVLDGFYDADGKVPCQIDGGLKCFGHPIGASGLRMIYEMYLQMQGRAGERQRKQEPRVRPHPQPRRLPAAQRLRHLHRRQIRRVISCGAPRRIGYPVPRLSEEASGMPCGVRQAHHAVAARPRNSGRASAMTRQVTPA